MSFERANEVFYEEFRDEFLKIKCVFEIKMESYRGQVLRGAGIGN